MVKQIDQLMVKVTCHSSHDSGSGGTFDTWAVIATLPLAEARGLLSDLRESVLDGVRRRSNCDCNPVRGIRVRVHDKFLLAVGDEEGDRIYEQQWKAAREVAVAGCSADYERWLADRS